MSHGIKKKPDLAHIRNVGSLVFVRTVGHRSKLADRSKPYILVGFSELTNKQYRVINPRATRRDLIIRPRIYDVHIEERRLTALDNLDKDSPAQKIRKIDAAGKPQWDPDSGEKFENHGPIAVEPRAMGSDNNDPPAAQPVARSTSTRSASPDPLRITARDLRVEQRQEHRDTIQNLINNNPGLLFPDELRDISPDPLFFAVLSALGEDPHKRVCPLALVSFKNNSEPFEPKNHKEAMANNYFKIHW